MKTFLKILNIFFIVLGALFLLVIIALSYLWIADPFNLRTFLPEDATPLSVIQNITSSKQVEIDNIDKNPLLNEEQEAQVEALGIDPANLPTEITPAMEKCFVEKLGQARAAELVAGAEPTAADVLKASSCIK